MPARTRRLSTDDAHRLIRRAACTAPDGPPRIGLELEWLTWPAQDPRRRVTPAEIDAAVDRGRPLPCGGRVTVEPGGQVELSSPPEASLAGALHRTATDAAYLRAALAAAGIRTEGCGLDASRPLARVLHEPRYEAMERYFDAFGAEGTEGGDGAFGADEAEGDDGADGAAGRTMMCATASVQLNIDVAGDPDRAWRLAHHIGPVLAAAFANSPGRGGRSQRLRTWAALDPSRTAPVGGAVAGPAWADYALAAPVMLFRVGDGARPVGARLPLAQWLADGHDGTWPTEDDIAYHLTTLFPPVRPRGWLELRMIDALPDPWWQVATAVAVALLHDADAGAAAGAACAGMALRWDEAARYGLGHPALAAAATRCFEAALEALPRLAGTGVTAERTGSAADEQTGAPAGASVDIGAACASYYERYVSRGRTPADDRDGRDGLDELGAVPSHDETGRSDRQETPAWA